MTTTNQFTFEVIKARIMRNVEDFWDVPSAAKLDPIVTRLAEILAKEIARVGAVAADFPDRIMQQLAETLAPALITAPRPAHAILHCPPLENGYILHQLTQFSYSSKASDFTDKRGNTQEQIYFTPLGSLKLFDVHPVYMASGTTLSRIDKLYKKTAFAKTSKGAQLHLPSLWLGLEIPEQVTDLDGLSLCFTWPQNQKYAPFYDLLSLAKAYVGITELPLGVGIPYQNEDVNEENKHLAHNATMNELKFIYHSRFLHCLKFSLETLGQTKNFPDAFIDHFAPEQLQKLNRPLLWLQFYFPPNFTFDVLDDLKIYTNAVPVANCRHAVAEVNIAGTEIIPLLAKKGDAFLSEGKVSDDNGKQYVPAINSATGNYRLFLNKQKRLDTRSIKNMMDTIPQLIIDERKAFNKIGQVFLQEHFDKLEKMFSALLLELSEGRGDGSWVAAYVIAKPFQDATKIMVGYWVTQHTDANVIKSGTFLEQINSGGLHMDKLVLLTKPRGGRAPMDEQNAIHAFNYWLMTRGRLLTNADINAFCRYELNGELKNIRTELKIEKSFHPKEGYGRTLCIAITPLHPKLYNQQEWSEICSELTEKIKLRSTGTIHYNVSLEN